MPLLKLKTSDLHPRDEVVLGLFEASTNAAAAKFWSFHSACLDHINDFLFFALLREPNWGTLTIERINELCFTFCTALGITLSPDETPLVVLGQAEYATAIYPRDLLGARA